MFIFVYARGYLSFRSAVFSVRATRAFGSDLEKWVHFRNDMGTAESVEAVGPARSTPWAMTRTAFPYVLRNVHHPQSSSSLLEPALACRCRCRCWEGRRASSSIILYTSGCVRRFWSTSSREGNDYIGNG